MNLEEMILSNINPSWTPLEKARFIYIELGKLVTFSTKFQNSSDKGFTELYYAKVSINKLESLEVNCRMWSQLYSQLLYKANIPNKIIDNGHCWVNFYIGEETYIADATYDPYTDLARIKNNDSTAHFGLPIYSKQKNNVVFNSEEWKNNLDNIDVKIGYNMDKKQELLDLKKHLYQISCGDIDISELAHSEVNDPILFKLEYLFSILGNLNDGYYESKDFVYELEMMLLTAEERSKLGAVELKKTNQDKTVSILQCIYTKHKEEPVYYLLAPNLPVQKFTANEIASLSEKGYGIESKTIPGIIYTKKFIPGKSSESLSYRLYKKFSSNKTTIDVYAETHPKVK